MRIALIRPEMSYWENKRALPYTNLTPYALAILAGLTPSDVEVIAYDDRLEKLPYDEPFDLVALSVGTFQAWRAYQVADRFRARGTKVVMGGFHPSFCPDEAAAHADAVAIGEAERQWPTIVEDARRGSLKRLYEQDVSQPLPDYLARTLVFHGKRYAPVSVVQFARGCKYNCDFCSVKAFYKGPSRARKIDDVVREITTAGHRWVFFVDDNLISDHERSKELLRAITPLGLHWVSQASLDVVDDPELLELTVKSGCVGLVIGLESLNGRNLSQMGKGWSRTDEYQRKLAILRDHGIMVYATFVFGYDGDRLEDFERTLDFAFKQKFFMANFNHLQPYPGTRLYRRLQQEGRLIYDRWWLDPRYRFGEAVFRPRGMTAEQLTEGTRRARFTFHAAAGIVRRGLDLKANLSSFRNAWVYLAMNVVSRMDVHRKQGIKLGAAAIPQGGEWDEDHVHQT